MCVLPENRTLKKGDTGALDGVHGRNAGMTRVAAIAILIITACGPSAPPRIDPSVPLFSPPRLASAGKSCPQLIGFEATAQGARAVVAEQTAEAALLGAFDWSGSAWGAASTSREVGSDLF